MELPKTMEVEDISNLQRLKQKFSSVCHATQFCGICLNADGSEKLWSIHTEFDIIVGKKTLKKLLKDIIEYLLNNESHHILASSSLCSQCTEKLIHSYLFIYNLKQVSKIIHKCVNELHFRISNIENSLESVDNWANSNVVIVLEQDDDMVDYIDIGKMTEIIAKESPKVNEPKTNEKTIVESITVQDITQSQFSKIVEIPIDIKNVTVDADKYEICEETENDQDIEISYLGDNLLSPKIKVEENTVLEITSPRPIKTKSKFKLNKTTFKCRICKVIIPTYKAWKAHRTVCKQRTLDQSAIIHKCKICNDSFISIRSLNAHYKTHGKLRCKVCQFITSEEDFTEHMKINHEDYIHTCKLCKFFSYSTTGLQTHIMKLHSGPQCALCFKNVKESDLKFHRCKFNCSECLDNVCIHYKYLISYRDQVINKAVEIKCPDCDYVCPRRETLLGHVNREHLDHHPFTCAHCEQQFYSRSSLRYHINRFHKERYICEFCDQEFYTKISLENHRKLCQCIERDHKCDNCNCSFNTLEELANHVKIRHEEDTFDCNLCENKFLSSVKLQDHLFKVHNGLQIKRKRSHLDCPVCDEKCKNRRGLLEHVKLHPDARFACKKCTEDFDCIRKLHAHMRIHYDDVIQCVNCKKVLTKTFFPHHMVYCTAGRSNDDVCTCETCGKTYPNEAQLKFHRKAHLAKVPCPKCQKPTRPVYMKGHMKLCKGLKGNKSTMDQNNMLENGKHRKYVKHLKCDWCDHMMSRFTELEAHVNRFHLKVKPYQCKYCKKAFFGKDSLKNHLITHTTVKAITCGVCNKTFQNNACLKLHMRRHTGVTPYTCEICGERFRTSSIMNTHKVKKHSERTVACPLCELMFHLTREMRSHFKKVHWRQSGKRFDPRDVKELSPAFYHLFEDGRVTKVEGEDLYISLKCNVKYE